MQNTKERLLKEYFGYDEFRAGQEEIIDSLLAGKDTLCIMPTGAGKSICYQLPALTFDGVTIVVSPLISLMKDQVRFLVDCGVRAAYINGSLSPKAIDLALSRMAEGRYKIIYVAPERINSAGFLNAVKPLKVSMLVVDEAHCISSWGHDFRPSYLDILKFIEKLPNRPTIGAFTATATKRVRDDICEILALNSPLIKITSFDRPNLYFEVRHPKFKNVELLSILAGRENESGIIYCGTRDKVEGVCDFLNKNGFSATRYHAGLSDEERAKNQDEFIYDNKRIMVATNAFGMGIDKSNVSFVIHYNMPMDMESYYQEAGRAGRDGNPAQCILLFKKGDINMNKKLIMQPEKDPTLVEYECHLLNLMAEYCNGNHCLRKYLLEYFGERYEKDCGNCGHCCDDNEYEDIDMSEQAKIVVRCIRNLAVSCGKRKITLVLNGRQRKKISEYGLDGNPECGALRKYRKNDVYAIIDKMRRDGLLEQYGDAYPILKVCDDVKEENLKFYLRVPVSKTAEKPQQEPRENKNIGTVSLFTRLKELRLKIARREYIPAYVVFTDATLTDMCRKMPTTREEFLGVVGVGYKKCESYSEEFLAEIKAYNEGN